MPAFGLLLISINNQRVGEEFLFLFHPVNINTRPDSASILWQFKW